MARVPAKKTTSKATDAGDERGPWERYHAGDGPKPVDDAFTLENKLASELRETTFPRLAELAIGIEHRDRMLTFGIQSGRAFVSEWLASTKRILDATPAPKQPDLADAATLLAVSLAYLCGERSDEHRAQVARAVDAVEGRGERKARARDALKELVRESEAVAKVRVGTTARDGEGGSDLEAWRAAWLRRCLPKLDPKFNDPDVAALERLVRRFGRKNGTAKLAANLAWRAGIETDDGTPGSGAAPPKVLERYRDADVKKARRARARK